MNIPVSEQRQIVWGVLAQFWVDTWYDSKQLDQFADQIAACGFSLEELDRIVEFEVCGAFALFTLEAFLTAGMALPDWFYPEDEARSKIASWLARPRILYYLNPCWIVGYAISRSFIRQNWSDLRQRVERRILNILTL